VECDRQPPIRRLLDRQLVVPSPNVLRQQLRWWRSQRTLAPVATLVMVVT